MSNLNTLYIDLIKKCVSYTLWKETVEPAMPKGLNSIFSKAIRPWLDRNNFILMKRFDYIEEKRVFGLDWPPLADTMIGLRRLDNIQYCVEKILQNNIQGDFIETGVWRGGASIFMKAILKAHDNNEKKIFLADSFQGLPFPDHKKYPLDHGDVHHQIDYLSVSLDQVKNNFIKYDLLDENIIFLPGWFKDTLPVAPIKKLSLIRLDGDMYESTINALENLYHKLEKGGFLIVDDYILGPCRQAIHDFRIKNSINEKIIAIDGTGSFWQKLQD